MPRTYMNCQLPSPSVEHHYQPLSFREKGPEKIYKKGRKSIAGLRVQREKRIREPQAQFKPGGAALWSVLGTQEYETMRTSPFTVGLCFGPTLFPKMTILSFREVLSSQFHFYD